MRSSLLECIKRIYFLKIFTYLSIISILVEIESYHTSPQLIRNSLEPSMIPYLHRLPFYDPLKS
jgi:hypothetical protein